MAEQPPKPSARRFAKKRFALSAAVVVLAVVIGLPFATRNSTPMPVYQGKTAREWMRDIGTSTVDFQAILAFRSMGSNAVPFLVHELERKDSVWEKLNQWIYPKLPLRISEHLPDPTEQDVRRHEATSALSEAGSRAAIPYMIHILNKAEDGLRLHALDVLKSIVQPADTNCIPAISDCLRSKDVFVCVEAAVVLRRMNAEKPAIAALTNFISSTDWQTRVYALDSLSDLDSQNSSKWHAMLTNDPDWIAEQWAAQHR